MIRPGYGVFHPAIFLIVAAATAFAFRQILSRSLSASDPTVTTVAYTAIVSSALLTLALPFVWQMPEAAWQVLLLIAIAVFAGIGEFFLSGA